MSSDADDSADATDHLRADEPKPRPRGPLGTHDDVPGLVAPAIGYCPLCHANARQSCTARGLFICPDCGRPWYDERVGEQMRTFDDYFSEVQG